MKFSTAKHLTLGLLCGALAIAVGGLLLLEEGTPGYTATAVLSIALMALGMAAGAIWGRCPHCGKHLFLKLLQWKTCPNCRRPLDADGRYRPRRNTGRRL